MSDVQSESWADNPFTFGKMYTLPDVKPQPVPIKGILRDFFAKLKAKYIKMPPAKIQPVEPVATTQWTPEMGMSDTLTDRFAPNPAFIGLPLKRKEIPSTTGTKGWNTHYNIMVDQSGSMKAKATSYEGVDLDRSLVCRLASSCLIKQASLNVDSFTVYSYNHLGKLLWPLPEGEPSYHYDKAIEWLTAESVNTLFNIKDHRTGSITESYNTTETGENHLLNALSAMVPDGENNESHAFEIMIRNMKKHDVRGMITVFITDGDNLAGPVKETSPESDGLSFDQWFRQFGHVFYILVREDEDSAIAHYVEATTLALMKKNKWDRKLAEKFVWGFPDPKMIDPQTGEKIIDIAEQMGWLFAQIGRIFAGTSEEFDDLAKELGEIGPDGEYKPPLPKD